MLNKKIKAKTFIFLEWMFAKIDLFIVFLGILHEE